MISLQYVAIFRLNPPCVLAASEREKTAAALKYCLVFMHETSGGGLGLNCGCDLPSAQQCMEGVKIGGVQGAVWDWWEPSYPSQTELVEIYVYI